MMQLAIAFESHDNPVHPSSHARERGTVNIDRLEAVKQFENEVRLKTPNGDAVKQLEIGWGHQLASLFCSKS